MKITVHTKPYSKKPGITKISKEEYGVQVSAIPHDGKANQEVVETLSVYFGIPKSRIILLRGKRSKTKIFECIIESDK